MKTFKTAAIITGIIVALISLQAHAAEKTKKEVEKHNAAVEAFGFGKTVEQKLVEDYLAGQQETEPVTTIAIIYNANDELAFEGEAENGEARELINKAAFLMEYDNTLYYRIGQ